MTQEGVQKELPETGEAAGVTEGVTGEQGGKPRWAATPKPECPARRAGEMRMGD